MAPPGYASSRRHKDYSAYLRDNNFKNNPRFGEQVDRLSSWLKSLLHPENHEYDQEVFVRVDRTGGGQPAGYEWRDVPESVHVSGGQVAVPQKETNNLHCGPPRTRLGTVPARGGHVASFYDIPSG